MRETKKRSDRDAVPASPTARRRGGDPRRDWRVRHPDWRGRRAAAVQAKAAESAMDPGKEQSIVESRATLEPEAELLDARAVRKARRANPRYHRRLNFDPEAFGAGGDVGAEDFALAVARYQKQHGLTVDGIAGPITCEHVGAASNTGESERPELENGEPRGAAALEPGAMDPGKEQSIVESRATLEPGDGAVQRSASQTPGSAADPHAAAARGVAGGGGALPHAAAIQASFGAHDIGGIRAHVGGEAAGAAEAIGAEAYATGSDVAFRRSPDLHTAAHEAAHVIQQKAGVSLQGGLGTPGDPYERHADAVADAVVRGESAAPLLDQMAGKGSGPSAAVQRKELAGRARSPFDRPSRETRARARNEGNKDTAEPTTLAGDLADIGAFIEERLAGVKTSLSEDKLPIQPELEQIATEASARLEQMLPRLRKRAPGEIYALVAAAEQVSVTVDHLYGWLVYDGEVSDGTWALVDSLNAIRVRLNLDTIAPERPRRSRTEDDQAESHCQEIAHEFDSICKAQSQAVDELLQDARYQDPPPIEVQILESLVQIALMTGVGAVCAAVSATTKAYFSVRQPDIDSIDAGFVAGVFKAAAKATISQTTTLVKSRYQNRRDPRDAFFGAQIDFLAELAERQRTHFLRVEKAEILRARDPVRRAKAYLDGMKAASRDAIKLEQKKATLDQWCVAQARGELGTVNPRDPHSPTSMEKKPGHLDPQEVYSDEVRKGRGTLDILVHIDRPGDSPDIVRAYIGGLNSRLRGLIEDRRIGDLAIPLVVRGWVGSADSEGVDRLQGPLAPSGHIWIARNEAGTLSIDVTSESPTFAIERGIEWLNKRAGLATKSVEGALRGAEILLEKDLAALSVKGKFSQ